MESAYVPPTAGGAWVAWYRSNQRTAEWILESAGFEITRCLVF